MKSRFHQIEFFIRYPIEVQQQLLFDLLNKAKHTEWGRKYRFDEINNYEEFKRRVPLNFYESFEREIKRLYIGEQNITWPTDIKWFAKSSGTTSSKSKFIPVSRESIKDCHLKGGKDLLSIYCNNCPNTEIFSGMSLGLRGSIFANNINNRNRSFYGDVSAIIMENLPFWVKILSTPSQNIFIKEWEEKIEAIVNITIKEDVRNLVGVPSWVLVLARKVLKKTGKSNLHEVWPNLELYMHGGVSFSPYRKQFEEILPNPVFTFLETYNASEGFFGIQDLTDSEEMLLMLDYGIFYEFILMSQFNGKDSQTIPLSEVKVGESYAVVISTNAGLWRYILGDTVCFTSVLPYRIQISGRTEHFINAFGEEVVVGNAETALRKACEKTDAAIVDYTVAPIYMKGEKSGTHQWVIEFSVEPQNFEYFVDVLDDTLKDLNSDYEAKRYKNMAIRRPEILIAPKGLFYRWLKSKGKLGGQNKVPRLSNTRDHIEELLKMNPLKATR